jgi:hypothetical protein
MRMKRREAQRHGPRGVRELDTMSDGKVGSESLTIKLLDHFLQLEPKVCWFSVNGKKEPARQARQ